MTIDASQGCVLGLSARVEVVVVVIESIFIEYINNGSIPDVEHVQMSA